jgi:hypothetical protein
VVSEDDVSYPVENIEDNVFLTQTSNEKNNVFLQKTINQPQIFQNYVNLLQILLIMIRQLKEQKIINHKLI